MNPSRAPVPEKVFPGIWQSLALVFAVLALDILVLLLLKRWGLMDAGGGMVAETAGIVVSNGLVTAVFLARRGLTLRNVLHPNPASARAVTGLLAVPVLLVSPAIFLASSIVDDLLELAYPMSDWYRRMFEEIGHHVEKIKRVRYGPLNLDIPPGEFRRLSVGEVEKLKSATTRKGSVPNKRPGR